MYYKVSPESALWLSPGILHVLRFLLAVDTHASPKLPKSIVLTQAQHVSGKGQASAHLCPTAVGNEGLVSSPGSERTSLKHQTTSDQHL